MDRQDQTTDGKFEGGIFSRMVMEENEAGQDSPEPHYFNYASVYMEKQKPLEKPPAEEAFKKIPESLGEGEPGDSKEAGFQEKQGLQRSRSFRRFLVFPKYLAVRKGMNMRKNRSRDRKPGQAMAINTSKMVHVGAGTVRTGRNQGRLFWSLYH